MQGLSSILKLLPALLFTVAAILLQRIAFTPSNHRSRPNDHANRKAPIIRILVQHDTELPAPHLVPILQLLTGHQLASLFIQNLLSESRNTREL